MHLPHSARRRRAVHHLGININLWWGLVLLMFGCAMVALGRRGTSSVRSSAATAEGRAPEAREKRTGLER